MSPSSRLACLLLLSTATAAACATQEEPSPAERPLEQRPEPVSVETPSATPTVTTRREGSVVARQGDRLFVADEDRGVLRVIPLPLRRDGDDDLVQTVVPLPGAPAQVLAFDDRVLVTIRDPGLLMSFDVDGEPTELGRTSLAADAWGMAVSPDGRTALVTSAWTQTVTAVDLETMTSRWSRGVRREPRGVVIMADGDTAYITHLSGASLTRFDDIDGQAIPRRVDFPAAPTRIPDDAYAEQRAHAATLAYAAALSPDGERLFVARHALGGVGRMTWAGEPTVDVLLTATDEPLAQPLDGPAKLSRIDIPLERRDHEVQGTGPIRTRHVFAQPRDVVYRERTDTLLIASEGRDAVIELDALAIDPSAGTDRVYALSPWADHTVELERLSDTDCGAPSGLALSEDEARAFVFCRSTATLAEVALSSDVTEATEPTSFRWRPEPDERVTLHDVAADPLDDEAAFGRRLFYDGRDTSMSFGMACAACHPDGRDDGHVWHEVPTDGGAVYRAFPDRVRGRDLHAKGEPRQTPMLAGRVDAEGPYGWRGKDETLMHRVLHGFNLHHTWASSWVGSFERERAEALVRFVRQGLVAPPEQSSAPLTAEQARGREVFDDPMTGCASCHVEDGGEYTDRTVRELDLRGPGDAFRSEEPARFRTPSLRFVAGTAPYLHDGSVDTLEQLVADNHDRMGRTTRLSGADQRALVAFLKSLGGGQAVDETLPAIPRQPRDRASQALSSAPTEAQWADAPEMELTRAPSTCQAFRLGDWVRIRCAHHVTEIAQFGGSTEGVTLGHGEPYVRMPTSWWDSPERVDDAILTFPIRQGDRRQFQLLHGRPVRWAGLILSTELAVSELWLEGEPGPTIVIH